MTSVLPIPTPTPGEATVDAWADKITQLAQELGGDGEKVSNRIAEEENVLNHATAQDAIDAVAEAGGGKVVFPALYDLGATGIVVADPDIVELAGVHSAWDVGGGSVLTYSGTGVAVSFGSASGVQRGYKLSNIQIRATGAAVDSATAVGLKLINVIGFQSTNPVIRDFNEGIGLLFQPVGTDNFGATHTFINPYIVHCKIGIRSLGTSAGIKDNHAMFFGGAIIGQEGLPAGSIGIDLSEHSDSYRFFGTDVETFDIGVQSDGENHAFFGLRTEFCNEHVVLTSGSSRNEFIGWSAQGTGTFWQDAGTLNLRLGSDGIQGRIPEIRPRVDASEIMTGRKADGTFSWDWSTNGEARWEFLNGTHVEGFSDNFTTSKYRLDGITGDIRAGRALKSQAAVTGSRPSAVTVGAGAMWFDTTLAKPIWSDGTVWRDAAGTAV